MKTYEVTIIEALRMKVEVEAESQQEAEQLVSDRWHHSEYILDAECFADVDFKARLLPRNRDLER